MADTVCVPVLPASQTIHQREFRRTAYLKDLNFAVTGSLPRNDDGVVTNAVFACFCGVHDAERYIATYNAMFPQSLIVFKIVDICQ